MSLYKYILQVLCANASDPDKDMRNPDKDMQYPDNVKKIDNNDQVYMYYIYIYIYICIYIYINMYI
jgi:hypothetical protein